MIKKNNTPIFRKVIKLNQGYLIRIVFKETVIIGIKAVKAIRAF